MSAGKSLPYNFAESFVHLTNGHILRGAFSFLRTIKVPKLPKEMTAPTQHREEK
jgi:hypothetical protein